MLHIYITYAYMNTCTCVQYIIIYIFIYASGFYAYITVRLFSP